MTRDAPPTVSHQFPQPGPLERRAPDDDLFHEPEAHPKTAATREPLPRSPYVTTTRHREALKSYKPLIHEQFPRWQRRASDRFEPLGRQSVKEPTSRAGD